MTSARAILLVEDNEDDVFFMRRALKEARVLNPMFVVEDGQMAVDYLSGVGKFSNRQENPLPAVVFLDLKLPFKSGHEVLEWIRSKREFDSLVTVVLTSSNEPSDLRKCYALGANSYLVKPPVPEQLLEMARALNWDWLERNDTPAGAEN